MIITLFLPGLAGYKFVFTIISIILKENSLDI